jgi:hypothetical protein
MYEKQDRRSKAVIVEHSGATEEYADVLAEMRLTMSEHDLLGEHVDGDTCQFEAAVVWRCTACGREHRQPLDS